MEERDHRHDGVFHRDAERVRRDRHHRVQDVGAVRVDDALGITGGAGGVAHAARGILVERGPAEIAIGLRKDVTQYKDSIVPPLLTRTKEKKQNVLDAIGAALDATVTYVRPFNTAADMVLIRVAGTPRRDD